LKEWRERWNESGWREYLAAPGTEEEIAADGFIFFSSVCNPPAMERY
jgi:hypothetical protein